MKPNLKEIRYDVERLRKASDRLTELHAAYCDAMEKINTAETSLKIIATWAKCSRIGGTEMARIETRAMDTLRLMK